MRFDLSPSRVILSATAIAFTAALACSTTIAHSHVTTPSAEPPGVSFAPIATTPESATPMRHCRFSAHSRMAVLLDAPQARNVLARYVPDVVSSPQIAMARGITLQDLAGFSQTGITRAKLRAMDSDLAQLQ